MKHPDVLLVTAGLCLVVSALSILLKPIGQQESPWAASYAAAAIILAAIRSAL